MKTIMVQMADEQWTMEAMHLACALARNTQSRLVLLYLVMANHPGLLGWGMSPPTTDEQDRIEVYAEVAEDYGVEFAMQPMQFISLTEALAQAVDLLDARVLFAYISPGRIPLWSRFQLWNLKRQLGTCHLYTLGEDQPVSMRGIDAVEDGMEQIAVGQR